MDKSEKITGAGMTSTPKGGMGGARRAIRNLLSEEGLCTEEQKKFIVTFLDSGHGLAWEEVDCGIVAEEVVRAGKMELLFKLGTYSDAEMRRAVYREAPPEMFAKLLDYMAKLDDYELKWAIDSRLKNENATMEIPDYFIYRWIVGWGGENPDKLRLFEKQVGGIPQDVAKRLLGNKNRQVRMIALAAIGRDETVESSQDDEKSRVRQR